MNELDKTLIKFFKDKSENLGDKDRIRVTEDLGMRKVAFDMYKVYNDHYDCLWKLESVGDEQFLVRASDPKYDYSNQGDWNLSSDYEGRNITLMYKSTPIERFASSEFGFDRDNLNMFKSALQEQLEDELFVRDVLAGQPQDKFNSITSTYPELKKYFK